MLAFHFTEETLFVASGTSGTSAIKLGLAEAFAEARCEILRPRRRKWWV
jgi:hypothetical protein